MSKIPNLDQTPEEVEEKGEDILSREQQLDIKFEDDVIQPTQDPLLTTPMANRATAMVVVETAPESCAISSNGSPLPESVLLTPVKHKNFEVLPKISNMVEITLDTGQIDMETSLLVEHISYEKTPIDINKTPSIQKRMIIPTSTKEHVPIIWLPINLASKAENLQLSAQAMELLKNTNI
ncbi:hypothetical protein DSO57_1007970 [Entomophthora muscae]|uniref:Uncharacterized protein n=1 Tax=Entomophthora muscae TaxID=34485 RepID=A0ACC2TIG9_9FUNG|nr:hypothetical protein DSO57_1007970 [Entomophthora muscae]